SRCSRWSSPCRRRVRCSACTPAHSRRPPSWWSPPRTSRQAPPAWRPSTPVVECWSSCVPFSHDLRNGAGRTGVRAGTLKLCYQNAKSFLLPQLDPASRRDRGSAILRNLLMDQQLAAFLEEGLVIHIATRSAALEPDGARVLAVKVDEDGEHLVA